LIIERFGSIGGAGEHGQGNMGGTWGHTFSAGDVWIHRFGVDVKGPPFGLIGRQHHVMQEKRM
jgi:hypothetical protein